MSNRMRRARANKGTESISRDMLQTAALTAVARGVLCVLLSLPDDWDCHGVEGLVKQFFHHDGTYKIGQALKELEAHGLFARLRRSAERGRYDWVWAYSDRAAELAQEIERLAAEGYRPVRDRKTVDANPQVETIPQSSTSGQSTNGLSMNGLSTHGEPHTLESLLPPTEVETEEEINSYTAASPPTREPADDGCDEDRAAAVRAERGRAWRAKTPRGLAATARSVAAERLCAEFRAEYPTPGETYEQLVLKVDKFLIRDKIPEQAVRQGLVDWAEAGYGHPNALHSFVMGALHKRPETERTNYERPMGTTDRRLAATEQLRREMAAEEAAGLSPFQAMLGAARRREIEGA